MDDILSILRDPVWGGIGAIAGLIAVFISIISIVVMIVSTLAKQGRLPKLGSSNRSSIDLYDRPMNLGNKIAIFLMPIIYWFLHSFIINVLSSGLENALTNLQATSPISIINSIGFAAIIYMRIMTNKRSIMHKLQTFEQRISFVFLYSGIGLLLFWGISAISVALLDFPVAYSFSTSRSNFIFGFLLLMFFTLLVPPILITGIVALISRFKEVFHISKTSAISSTLTTNGTLDIGTSEHDLPLIESVDQLKRVSRNKAD